MRYVFVFQICWHEMIVSENTVSLKFQVCTVRHFIDIQIIKDIFYACVTAEEILGMPRLTERVNDTGERLPGIKIGADGTIQEWYEDYEEAEPGHRHLSHLYALYPSNQITASDPDFYEAALKTVVKRVENEGGWPGWSGSWVINLFARLKKSEACHEHITAFLRSQKTEPR